MNAFLLSDALKNVELRTTTKADPDSEVAQMLLPFFSEHIPVLNGKVDMRLFDASLLEQAPAPGSVAASASSSSSSSSEATAASPTPHRRLRPAAKTLSNRIRTAGVTDSYWMVALSGSGKTSSLFDMALSDQHYVMYLQCTAPGDVTERARRTSEGDVAFA